MRESIVFIVDKPSFARALAPHLSTRWPTSRIHAITTLRLGLYEFRYPRGLNFNAFPYIAEPSWKPRPQASSPAWSIDDGVATRIESSSADLLRDATKIIFAGDPDPSGAVAYHVLLSQCLAPDAVVLARPALHLMGLDETSIARSLDAISSTADTWFVECLNAGLARRFFDFNFNVNALALLRAPLRQVGVDDDRFTVSKFSLQLLYGIRELPAMSEGKLIELMHQWPGTGRHARSELGSPASRAAIVSGLSGAGLLVADHKARTKLSERGQAFLSQLHPDCKDADLPARIRQWESEWPASKPSIERYLRTYFGKQKRFSSPTSPIV
ncbi:hypothetical protein [uncultured Variovorax sp.]|uniref:hypothetical protein n=1 Tax=uncultured Variovorax sp. TaxID=114708 RepID=UPI002625E960|nr:hypothetical protein [uncultured Variovorax sp.]